MVRLATAAVVLIASLHAAAHAQDAPAVPAAFLRAWQSTADQAPADARAGWQAFAQEHAPHDLAELARVLAGVAALREGADDEAALAHFDVKAAEGGSEFRKQLAIVGKGLTARVRMRRLAAKLQDYYRRHVEYPPDLAALVAEGLATEAGLTDPFGQRYAYEARPRKLAPDVPRQAFTLKCTAIDAAHDELASDLRRAAEAVRPITISSLDPARQTAYLRRPRADGTPGPAESWSVGRTADGLTLLAVYDSFAVVAWKQFPVAVSRET